MNSHFVMFKLCAGVILLTWLHSVSFLEKTFDKNTETTGLNDYYAPPPAPSKKIFAGYMHTIAIATDSSVWTWGNNNQGQLGVGATGIGLYPQVVNGLSRAVEAAGGNEHSLVLLQDGTVWAFGRNSEGQLGNASLNQKTSPEQVVGLSDVQHIGAGFFHSLAIKNDGTLWSWGYNAYGQLGNSNTFNSVTPAQVPGIDNAAEVVAGENFSLVRRNDGTLSAWGYNANGQLGDGTTTNRSTPFTLPAFSATAIAAGRSHCLALKSNGTVWGWGYNGYGQLGNGNTTDQKTPVQVSGLTNVIAIAAGEYFSMALKTDGTVWAWGFNVQGQLGIGSTDGSAHSAPVQTNTLTAVESIAAGTFGVAAKNDGSVWGWGYNNLGPIGNGTTNSESSPVSSLFSFASVSSVARPAFATDGGAYVTAQSVTVTCATGASVIHYTTNGIDPVETDPVIASGSTLNIPKGTTVLKAKGL